MFLNFPKTLKHEGLWLEKCIKTQQILSIICSSVCYPFKGGLEFWGGARNRKFGIWEWVDPECGAGSGLHRMYLLRELTRHRKTCF